MRNLLSLAGLLALLASTLAVNTTQAQAQTLPPGDIACVVAGSGSTAFGPLPAAGPFAGIGSLRSLSGGGDGAVYLADAGLIDEFGGVAKIDAAGQMTLVQEEGRFLAGLRMEDAWDVAVDASGTAWIVDDVRLARLNPDLSSEDLTNLLPVGLNPVFVELGADGSLYVGSTDQLVRIAPDDTVTELVGPATIIPGVDNAGVISSSRIQGIAAATGGGVWINAYGAVDNRIVLASNSGGFSQMVSSTGAVAIDVDDQGTLWFVNNRGEVFDVDPLPELVVSLDQAVIGGRTFREADGLAVVDGSIYVANLGLGIAQVIRVSNQPCPAGPYIDGPLVCTVATSDSVSPLLPNGSFLDFAPTGVAVDGASVVHVAWAGDATLSGGVIRTDRSTSTVVAEFGELLDGAPFGVPTYVAASETTGEIFLGEATNGDNRVLRRTADGTWSTWVRESDDVSGSPIGNLTGMAMRDNTNLYLSTDTRVIRTFNFFNGVEIVQLVWQVALSLGQVAGIALTGGIETNEPLAWIADRGQKRLYVRVPGGTIDVATDFFELELAGDPVRSALKIAADGSDMIVEVQLDNGLTRLTRRAGDGTYTPIVGEFMLLDGRPLDVIGGLDVGPNGDIYIADIGSQRLLRLPASGDCATPPPPLVDVAASVNCDDEADVIDALFIVQYEVEVRTATYGCPLANPASELNISFADVNGDGEVNVVDALFIAQCDVGVPNASCPAL